LRLPSPPASPPPGAGLLQATTGDAIFSSSRRDWETGRRQEMSPEIVKHEAATAVFAARKAGILEAIKRMRRRAQDTVAEEGELDAMMGQAPVPPLIPRLLYADASGGARAYAGHRLVVTTGWRRVVTTRLAQGWAWGRALTRLQQLEFDAFLEYGILAHGFLRLRCGDCRSVTAGCWTANIPRPIATMFATMLPAAFACDCSRWYFLSDVSKSEIGRCTNSQESM